MAFENISWTLAEGHSSNVPFHLRFRDFSTLFPKKLYPSRINLYWTMQLPSLNGLGSHAEINVMQLFEKTLLHLIEYDKQSILSMVHTQGNRREYVFHSKDHSIFLQRIAQIPQPPEGFPVHIQSFDDEQWLYDNSKMNLLGIH